jgi:hypothetical protein
MVLHPKHLDGFNFLRLTVGYCCILKYGYKILQNPGPSAFKPVYLLHLEHLILQSHILGFRFSPLETGLALPLDGLSE